MIIRLILAIFILVLTNPALSQTVTKIEIEGLKRTKPYVVLNELPFSEGDLFQSDLLQEGIARLKNTGLFSEVSANTRSAGEGVIVEIKTIDRWTTIPIFKVSSGGGVSQYILGVFDPNILGHFIEAGAQYERLGETNSGVGWLKIPRLFGDRMSLFVQAWNINRLRKNYEQAPLDPTLQTGFLQTRKRYSIDLSKEFRWWLEIGALIEYHKDDFSDRYLDEETKALQELVGLPPSTTTEILGGKVRLGRIVQDTVLADGLRLELSHRQASHKEENLKPFHQTDLDIVGVKSIGLNSTVAQRLMIGTTNTDTIQYRYYLGGLDTVRGFVDNRFAGRTFWLSNSEYRYAFFRSKHLVLQSNIFHDAAGISENGDDLDRATGASIGGGIRFIAPGFYRLVGRLDFAKPIVKRDEIPISFGVQQFF